MAMIVDRLRLWGSTSSREPVKWGAKRVAQIALLMGMLALWPGHVARADATTDYNLAVTFYKQKQWDRAAAACEDFLAKYPEHNRAPLTRLYWGQSLIHVKKFREARGHFRRFAEDAPRHPDLPLALYRIGECSYFVSDFAEAKEEFLQFLREFQDHDLAEWAQLYLAESLFRLNDVSAAVAGFEQYRQRYPNGNLIDDAEYGLARALELQGDREEAIQLYTTIANRPGSPRASEALFNLGARHFDDANYAAAAQAFEEVGRVDPEHHLASLSELNAGYARFHLEEYDKAISHFEKARSVAELTDTASYWLGLSHKSAGRHVDAAEVFEQSLNRRPDQPLAQNLTFHWGDAELRNANYAAAMELLERCAQRWPDGELGDDALHSASQAALLMADLPKALKLNEEFIKSYPGSGLRFVQALVHGRTLLAWGDQQTDGSPEKSQAYRDALTVLKRVTAEASVPETLHNATFQLARAHERLGESREVVSVLDELLGNGEALPALERRDALLLRANALLRLQDHENAQLGYWAFLEVVSEDTERRIGLIGLANAQLGLKAWEPLESTLQELGTIDPEDRQFSPLAVAAGDGAFDEGEWERAIRLFQQVLDLGETGTFYAEALSGKGHALYETEQFQQAADAFEALASLTTQDDRLRSHAYYMTALSARRAGETARALKWYQQGYEAFTLAALTEVTPDAVPIGENAYRCAKGGARTARTQFEENRDQESFNLADKMYEAAYQELKRLPVDQQSELDLLINEWADLSYNAKDYDRSDELYALLLTERPESDLADDAKLILAESLRFSDRLEDAREAFKTLSQAPGADDFVRQRAFVHLLDLAAESSDWPAVLESARRLASDFPESDHTSYVQYRTGEALLQMKEYEDAADTLGSLNQTLAMNFDTAPPWWPESWLLLADAKFRLKQYEEMEAILTDLTRKAPGSPILYRADALIGQSYENQARFEEARAAYQRVVDSDTGRGTETAAECQFRIAESYLKEKNYEAAYTHYYKVSVGYESEMYEPAALIQAARCDAALKRWRGAVATYQKLIDEFPGSQFVEPAQTELREIETRHPELKRQDP